MIIALTGSDTFRSRERLKFFKGGFIKKYDPHALNIVTLDGEKMTPDDLKNAIGSGGLLSKKRMVIVENLLNNKSSKKRSEIYKMLETAPLDDTVIIFWDYEEVSAGKKPPKKSKLEMPDTTVERFEELTPAQLSGWVDKEVKKRGGELSAQAKNLLLKYAGTDLWKLSTELDKLVSHAGKNPISESDIKELVSEQYDTSIFNFIDAISERKVDIALNLLSDQMASGASPQYILTMLIRQVRMLLQIRDIIDCEGAITMEAKGLGIHPFVLRKITIQSKHFTTPNLKRLYERLLTIDETLKTGTEDARVLFQLFILEATGSAVA